jgi:hypothetical protein
MLDASSIYDADGQGSLDQKKQDPTIGEATHHRFFTTDLESLEYRVLSDIPHINGSSMVYVDSIYYMVTSTAFFGDLVVMKYDEDWNYLGSKVLAQRGNWSMSTVYDEESARFYVSYMDTSKNATSNVRLAVFDTEWNSLTDIAVTQYAERSFIQGGRPWVILNDGRAYVSYDVTTGNSQTLEQNKDWQCTVSMYTITD